jgi:peptide/nickel transport system substrate-binding protein
MSNHFGPLLTRRHILRLALVSAGSIAGSLLSACQPAVPSTPLSSASTPAPAAKTTGTAAPAAVSSANQKPVVIVQGADPATLDPQFLETGILSTVTAGIFNFLTRYDRGMNVVGDAAQEWKLSDDRTTYTFTIRQGIKFWNGEPLDAKAVEFTFNRMLDPELRKQKLTDAFPTRVGLESVKATGAYTVEMKLKTANITFDPFLTFEPILAPGYYGSKSIQDTAIVPMGSGPWKFVEWVKDDHITLEANPDYYRGKPQIGTLLIKPVPQGATRLSLLQTGEADLIADVSPDDIASIEKDAKLRLSTSPGGRRMVVGMPTRKYTDRRVREAFNLAMDYDSINTALFAGKLTGRMAVPVNGDFWIDPSIKPYPYDPPRARQLLADAKYPLDTKSTIYTPTGSYLKGKEICLAVADALKKIGLTNIEVQEIDAGVYSQKLSQKQLGDMYLLGAGSRFFAPDDASVLSSRSPAEETEWYTQTESGPEFEQIMNELYTTFDKNKQKELMYRVESLMRQESPWILLFQQLAAWGVNRRIDWTASGNTRIDLYLPNEPDVHFAA